jgi:hypothetical protein
MYYGIKKINEKYKINIPVEMNISSYVKASTVHETGSLNVLT